MWLILLAGWNVICWGLGFFGIYSWYRNFDGQEVTQYVGGTAIFIAIWFVWSRGKKFIYGLIRSS